MHRNLALTFPEKSREVERQEDLPERRSHPALDVPRFPLVRAPGDAAALVDIEHAEVIRRGHGLLQRGYRGFRDHRLPLHPCDKVAHQELAGGAVLAAQPL